MPRSSWKSHPCTCYFGESPQPKPSIVPLHPSAATSQICAHVFFWGVCPGPTGRIKNTTRVCPLSISPPWFFPWAVLPCLSPARACIFYLTLSYVPYLRLLFSTQSQVGAAFMYLLGWRLEPPQTLQSKPTPNLWRADLWILPMCSEITKLGQQQKRKQPSIQHSQPHN